VLPSRRRLGARFASMAGSGLTCPLANLARVRRSLCSYSQAVLGDLHNPLILQDTHAVALNRSSSVFFVNSQPTGLNDSTLSTSRSYLAWPPVNKSFSRTFFVNSQPTGLNDSILSTSRKLLGTAACEPFLVQQAFL
jgi:hypothetical protein